MPSQPIAGSRGCDCGHQWRRRVPNKSAYGQRERWCIGVDVPDDAQGCLQDIHWSFGAVGYFPSYTLGAVIAVQLFEAAQRAIGAETLDAQLEAGEFAPLRPHQVHLLAVMLGSPSPAL